MSLLYPTLWTQKLTVSAPRKSARAAPECWRPLGNREWGASTSEASRGHRDSAHAAWLGAPRGGQSGAANPTAFTRPRRTPIFRDPLVHPRQQLGAPRSLPPVLTRRRDVQRTLGLGGPRVSRFPARLRWIPRRRLHVPAGGGARAQEQGAAGAAVTSTSTGGEGAGRGQGRRRRAGGGERATRGAGERGRLGRLGPELASSGRRPRSDKYISGARGAADAARAACTVGRRAPSRPAKARRPRLLLPRPARSSGERRARPPAPGPRSR